MKQQNVRLLKKFLNDNGAVVPIAAREIATLVNQIRALEGREGLPKTGIFSIGVFQFTASWSLDSWQFHNGGIGPSWTDIETDGAFKWGKASSPTWTVSSKTYTTVPIEYGYGGGMGGAKLSTKTPPWSEKYETAKKSLPEGYYHVTNGDGGFKTVEIKPVDYSGYETVKIEYDDDYEALKKIATYKKSKIANKAKK